MDQVTKKFFERNTPKYEGVYRWNWVEKPNIQQIYNTTKKKSYF